MTDVPQPRTRANRAGHAPHTLRNGARRARSHRGRPDTRLALTRTVSHGSLVLAVKGEIDLANRDRFEATVREELSARAPRDRVVLDFSGVDFVDSSGVHALVGLVRKADALRVQVRIAGATPWVTRIFRLTGLDIRFPVHRSLEQALAAFVPGP